MAFCHWVWRLDPCKHCGSSNVELIYLGSKNRLDGRHDTPPITKCRDCGKYSDDPVGVNNGDKHMIFFHGLNQNENYLATWLEIKELERENKALEKEFIQRQINELTKEVDDLKRQVSKDKDFIHNAKCCAKCAFYSPVDITTGECDKNLRLVRIYQVCDYFIER